MRNYRWFRLTCNFSHIYKIVIASGIIRKGRQEYANPAFCDHLVVSYVLPLPQTVFEAFSLSHFI